MEDNTQNRDSSQYDLTFKMIVIGDPGVGKSCLTGRALKNEFDQKYAPTIGFEFLTYNVNIQDKVIKLQIWDTCGQEMYRSLITNFYRNSSLAMMVYSIDSKESFEHINVWLKEVKVHSNPDIKIILIGNKCDLEEKRQVSYKEAKQFQEETEAGAVSGFFASADFIESGGKRKDTTAAFVTGRHCDAEPSGTASGVPLNPRRFRGMSGISEGAAPGRKFQEAKIPGAVKRADSAERKNKRRDGFRSKTPESVP